MSRSLHCLAWPPIHAAWALSLPSFPVEIRTHLSCPVTSLIEGWEDSTPPLHLWLLCLIITFSRPKFIDWHKVVYLLWVWGQSLPEPGTDRKGVSVAWIGGLLYFYWKVLFSLLFVICIYLISHKILLNRYFCFANPLLDNANKG